jgi:hypothetical protein
MDFKCIPRWRENNKRLRLANSNLSNAHICQYPTARTNTESAGYDLQAVSFWTSKNAPLIVEIITIRVTVHALKSRRNPLSNQGPNRKKWQKMDSGNLKVKWELLPRAPFPSVGFSPLSISSKGQDAEYLLDHLFVLNKTVDLRPSLTFQGGHGINLIFS